MRIVKLATLLAVLFVVTAPAPVSAAGWTGSDSSPLRDPFPSGLVLKRVWEKLGSR
jgi:hypothetical protein